MEAARRDVEALIRSDLEFHTTILEASGNQFLLPLAHAIRATLWASLSVTNPDAEEKTNPDAEENRMVSLPLHATILEAILEGDEDAARLLWKTTSMTPSGVVAARVSAGPAMRFKPNAVHFASWIAALKSSRVAGCGARGRSG